MSYCAIATSAPSVAANPPAGKDTIYTPESDVPVEVPTGRSDEFCNVTPPTTPIDPTDPAAGTLTFVAVNDSILVQKNSVITFNVGGPNGEGGRSDYILRTNADQEQFIQPVVEFLVLSDTSNLVPATEGVVTWGTEEGQYIFTPATNFVGDVTVWEYTATDFGTDGVTEDTAFVRIRVIDGPVDACRGLEWQGAWVAGKEYKDGLTGDCTNRDVVKLADNSCLYVCIKSHLSEDMLRPEHSDFDGAAGWLDYWEKMVEDTGIDSTAFPEVSFFNSLYNGVFDWMKNATIGDWIGAITIGAGIAWAGSKILDSFTGSGKDDEADSRYTGSPTFTGAYNAPSLRSVCQSLCVEAGISNYDVSQLSNTIKCHFNLSQQTSVRTILDNLSRAFQFDMVDSAGILKFVPRNTNVIRTLTHQDMGFNTTSDNIAPVTMKRLQSVDLPRSVSLTYMAEDLDYNNYTQRAEIATFSAGNDINLSVPFMLSHEDAKDAVDRLLIGAHLERMQYTFKTSYKNCVDLEPSDVIQIPEGLVRIIQIEEVNEGILEIHCVDAGVTTSPTAVYDGSGNLMGYSASTYTGTGQQAQLPQPVLNTAYEVIKTGVLWFDPPAQNAEDINPRVYAAIHGFGEETWKGADLFISRDGGGSYVKIGSTNTASKWGLVEAVTPAAAYHTFDNTTVIRVKMKSGQLLSKTDSAVLAGENLCMVGQECVAFGVATLVAPNTYDLSHLLRGRRGSEWAISTHVANELFVMLDGAPVPVELTEADRSKQFLFKAVSFGSDLTKVESDAIQIIGENTVPWTAANLRVTKTGSDFRVNWLERPRFANQFRDYIDGVHDFDFGGYAIIIYNGTTAVRQQIIFEPTFSYTAAMQISDFGAVQTGLKVSVSQVSNKYGGSRPITVNIP